MIEEFLKIVRKNPHAREWRGFVLESGAIF
jgi:hypothetical protein